MLSMKPSEIKRHRKKHRLLCSPVLKNPVQSLGLDLAFLVVASISLQAAVVMSTQMALVHLGTVIAAMIFCRHLPHWVRPIAYVAVATLITLGSSAVVRRMMPVTTDMLGMYVYLVAVNGMTFFYATKIKPQDKIYPVLAGALKGLVGFVCLMFAVSLLREYLGLGALWGRTLPFLIASDGLLVPFFGFIALGFVLAGLRLIGKKGQALSIEEQARREAVFKIVDIEEA